MFSMIADRRQLLDVLEPGVVTVGAAKKSDGWLRPQRAEDVALVWEGDPTTQTLPNVVLVPKEQHREFFAWASTYLPRFKPLTAFCRVLDPEVAERAFRDSAPPDLHGLDDAVIGMILCESVIHLQGRLDLKQLSPSACSNSLGFAMARALALRMEPSPALARNWLEARRLARQSDPRLSIDDLREPWVVLVSIADRDSVASNDGSPILLKIIAACDFIRRSGEIPGSQLELLAPGFAESIGSLDPLRGTREQRVRFFESAAVLLSNRNTAHLPSSAFILGYLGSRIGEGAFDYWDLVVRLAVDFPTALMWYGLCAGLMKASNTQDYANSLGRRVRREVIRSEGILECPRCDISLEELRVLGDRSLLSFRTERTGMIEVEIAPRIRTTVRVAAEQATSGELFEAVEQPRDLRPIADELGSLIDRLRLLKEKMLDKTARPLAGSTREFGRTGRRRSK